MSTQYILKLWFLHLSVELSSMICPFSVRNEDGSANKTKPMDWVT